MSIPVNYRVDSEKVSASSMWQRHVISDSTEKIFGGRRSKDMMSIELMVDVPVPVLVLLIGPQAMDSTFSKVISETRVRGGWVLEHWGEDLDQLSASGTSGAFISGTNPGGLTRYDRRGTAAFQNIRSLETLYRNNGVNYVSSSNTPELVLGGDLIKSVGSVMITYAGVLWVGRFASFSLEETADKPFCVDWSFQFVVHERFPSWRPDCVEEFLFNTEPIPDQKQGSGNKVPISTPIGPTVPADYAAYKASSDSSSMSFDEWKQVQGGTPVSTIREEQSKRTDVAAAKDVRGNMESVARSTGSGSDMKSLLNSYDPNAGTVESAGSRVPVGKLPSSYGQSVLSRMVG